MDPETDMDCVPLNQILLNTFNILWSKNNGLEKVIIFDLPNIRLYTKLDRVALLVPDPPRCNSTTMHTRVVSQDSNICLGRQVYLPGLAKPQ